MYVFTSNDRGYQYMPPQPEEKKIDIKKWGRVNASMKIKTLVEENPRQKDSMGWKSWNLIKEGMMVFEYLAAGGRTQDLMYDLRKGRIELYE